jgi:endo-beta-N-acetylglucosaminidase D
VIWYDSVTTEGKLKWQNELNQLNRWLLQYLLQYFM